MQENNHRFQGRYITAQDLADRLLPDDLNINEVLLWSPDLFAYTSYIMTVTSAYQLVVSPPSGEKWQPDKEEIYEWLKFNPKSKESIQIHLENWLEYINHIWGRKIDTKDKSAQIAKKIEDDLNEFETDLDEKLSKKEFDF